MLFRSVDKVDITGEIMTESDRAMLEKITERIDNGEQLAIIKDMTEDG